MRFVSGIAGGVGFDPLCENGVQVVRPQTMQGFHPTSKICVVPSPGPRECSPGYCGPHCTDSISIHTDYLRIVYQTWLTYFALHPDQMPGPETIQQDFVLEYSYDPRAVGVCFYKAVAIQAAPAVAGISCAIICGMYWGGPNYDPSFGVNPFLACQGFEIGRLGQGDFPGLPGAGIIQGFARHNPYHPDSEISEGGFGLLFPGPPPMSVVNLPGEGSFTDAPVSLLAPSYHSDFLTRYQLTAGGTCSGSWKWPCYYHPNPGSCTPLSGTGSA